MKGVFESHEQMYSELYDLYKRFVVLANKLFRVSLAVDGTMENLESCRRDLAAVIMQEIKKKKNVQKDLRRAFGCCGYEMGEGEITDASIVGFVLSYIDAVCGKQVRPTQSKPEIKHLGDTFLLAISAGVITNVSFKVAKNIVGESKEQYKSLCASIIDWVSLLIRQGKVPAQQVLLRSWLVDWVQVYAGRVVATTHDEASRKIVYPCRMPEISGSKDESIAWAAAARAIFHKMCSSKGRVGKEVLLAHEGRLALLESIRGDGVAVSGSSTVASTAVVDVSTVSLVCTATTAAASATTTNTSTNTSATTVGSDASFS